MMAESSVPEQLVAEDRTWLESITVAEALPPVPKGTELLEILGDLAVPDPEIDVIVRLRPRIDDHELRYILDRVLTVLSAGIGASAGQDRFPDLRGFDDPLARISTSTPTSPAFH